MNQEELDEYQDKIGSPEMEHLQYLNEHPEIHPEELASLEEEASQPTIEDQREQITKEIEELRQQIEAKQMLLLKL